jgi:hypothetical protein
MVGGDREGLTGVVVNPVENLDMGAVVQPPMGEVGLPTFVGLFGGEPDVGRLGPFLRRRCDLVGRTQVPVDAPAADVRRDFPTAALSFQGCEPGRGGCPRRLPADAELGVAV